MITFPKRSSMDSKPIWIASDAYSRNNPLTGLGVRGYPPPLQRFNTYKNSDMNKYPFLPHYNFIQSGADRVGRLGAAGPIGAVGCPSQRLLVIK